MCDKIKCPKCNSENVIAIDSEPMEYKGAWLIENNLQFDSEIYLRFKCNESLCGNVFSKDFDIVPRVKKKKVNLFITVSVEDNADLNELAKNIKLAMENSDNVTTVASSIEVATQAETFN